eukprot:scaffold2134_cov384-Prasinococcus_capsulatus_cf.AAC.7
MLRLALWSSVDTLCALGRVTRAQVLEGTPSDEQLARAADVGALSGLRCCGRTSKPLRRCPAMCAIARERAAVSTINPQLVPPAQQRLATAVLAGVLRQAPCGQRLGHHGSARLVREHGLEVFHNGHVYRRALERGTASHRSANALVSMGFIGFYQTLCPNATCTIE